MTTDLIVTDLQKQDIGTDGELVQVFEIQLNDSTWVYLANEYSVPSAGTKITFRNRDTPADTNTYHVVPIEMDGVESSTSGPMARPLLTIANVCRTLDSSSFEGALYLANGNSSVDFDSLLGNKVIRRTTLRKYLADGSGDSNPPVEYPSEIYFLDRLTEESNTTVAFELVSAFDLEGITLPRRTISANACSWSYQGASDHLYEYEKKGGCTWNAESAIYIGGVRHNVYVNKEDEYVFPSHFTYITFDTSATAKNLYKTIGTGTVRRVSESGTLGPEETVNEYWMCKNSTSETPSDTSGDWYRIRLYTPYTANLLLNVYYDSDYNTYALYASVATVKGVSKLVHNLWKAKFKSQESNAHILAPGYNSYWVKGDLCGKTLTSCTLRFGAQIEDVITSTSYSAASNVISSIGHGLTTGQPITYSNVSSVGIIDDIGGIDNGQTYYVIRLTADAFQLSASPEETAIDLTGDGDGTHQFSISKVTGIPDPTAIKPFGAFPTARNF